MKSKLEIYALSVCFASIVCLVISSSFIGYGLIEIITPQTTMNSYEYMVYQSNDNYWERYKANKSNPRPSEEVLTKERIERFQAVIENEKRDGLRNILQSITFVLSASVALLIHWKIAKSARKG